MIYEYALEPEMVAKWGDLKTRGFFLHAFGLTTGRLVSRYPKNWAKRVWKAFDGDNQMDRKRLEELLARLQETMIKRKDFIWDDGNGGWLENALLEHDRHPFKAIFVSRNPKKKCNAILVEEEVFDIHCTGWENPHGRTVNRKANDMAAAVKMMLSRCQWVKFIDPHISPGRSDYRRSLRAFLNILADQRPVGPVKKIEIHTGVHPGTADFLRDSFEKLIPNGVQVTLYQWQEKPGGQILHNRYILTDLGGVSFHHGLDAGKEGEKDDINRLSREQYVLRCQQYNAKAPAFLQGAEPLVVKGSA